MQTVDLPVFALMSGHGHPIFFHDYQDTFPIAIFCLGAAAVIAILWLLAELLD